MKYVAFLEEKLQEVGVFVLFDLVVRAFIPTVHSSVSSWSKLSDVLL